MSTPPQVPSEQILEAVRILKEDKYLAGLTAQSERLAAMEERIKRMPVKELSLEEKAAEFDRLQKESEGGGGDPPPWPPGSPPAPGQPPADPPGGPPPPGPPPAPPPKPADPPAPPPEPKKFGSKFLGYYE